MSNTITEGRDRELPPDANGEIKRAATPAVGDLTLEVLDAWRHKEVGQGDAMRARSSIESRTDLRLAATNEAMRADPDRPSSTVVVEQEIARRWADLDASDFGRIRSDSRREVALESIAGHMRASPEYAQEIKKRSPVIADAAQSLNNEREKAERDAAAAAEQERRAANLSAAKQTREAVIDAAALASLALLRSRQTARVVDELTASPSTSTQQLRDAQASLKTPPLDGRVTSPDDPDIAANLARAIKRPVTQDQLSEALLTRFIVSREKRTLLDQGVTEFTFRNGEHQGRVAFVDAGKALRTELEDKSTIRSMVEVAASKNWKEITVGGTDDFRRNAWLEASLNDIKVRGYEPREADKQILAELQADRKERAATPTQTNSIELVDRVQKRDEVKSPSVEPTPRKHIDGDALTQAQKGVLDQSRTLLQEKGMVGKSADASLLELESRLRGERVYVGELVDHGRAPYQFDKKNDQSYYVTLKTPAGEQVIWGKGLASAMEDRRPGEQIVLQNTGRQDVTVRERVLNEQGDVVGHRPKDSHLNQWKSELLSQVSEKARTDFANRSVERKPTMGVYDSKAPRIPSPQQDAVSRPEPVQQRNQEPPRSNRER